MTKIWRQPKEAKKVKTNERDWEDYLPVPRRVAKKRAAKKGKKAKKRLTPLEKAQIQVQIAVRESLEVFEENLRDRIWDIPMDFDVPSLIGTNMPDLIDAFEGIITEALHECLGEYAPAGAAPVDDDDCCGMPWEEDEPEVVTAAMSKKDRKAFIDKLINLVPLVLAYDDVRARVQFVTVRHDKLQLWCLGADDAIADPVVAIKRTGKLLRVYEGDGGGVHEFEVSKFPPAWTAALACGHTYNL